MRVAHRGSCAGSIGNEHRDRKARLFRLAGNERRAGGAAPGPRTPRRLNFLFRRNRLKRKLTPDAYSRSGHGPGMVLN